MPSSGRVSSTGDNANYPSFVKENTKKFNEE